MASTLAPRELARRWTLLAKSARGEEVSEAQRTRFWFDPAYAAFLEDVRRSTPEDATIAVLVPRSPDSYTYLAAYLLAPRRIVDAGGVEQAAFVATYRTRGGLEGDPIAQGTLRRR